MHEQITGLIAPTVASIFAIVFLAIWWRARIGPHVLAFAGCYGASACAFLATQVLPTDSLYTFHITHLLYALALGMLLWGATHRAGQPAFLGTLTTIYAVAAITLSAAVVMSDDAAPRVLITNTSYGVMILVGLVSLLGAPRRNLLDALMVFILAVNAADFMVRPMLQVLVEGAIPAAEYRQSLYYSIISLALSLKAVTLAIVLVGTCVYEMVMVMRERADRDPLTGLRNRRAFESDIANPLMHALQKGVPVSLVVADIDHFKQVNDLWGHQAGDKAIAAFGQLIESTIRSHDIAGRIGGEEFCVLVWDCPEAAALRLAERIRASFASHVHPEIGDNICLTASFGVSALRAGDSYDRLFARADAALYRAKENGRNRVEDGEQQVLPTSPEARERRRAAA